MAAATQKKPPQIKLRYIPQILQNAFALLVSSPQEYPEMVKTGIPGKNLYIINHPDIAKHILHKNSTNYTKAVEYAHLALSLGKGLITNEGDNWHKQRTLIQPAFHRQTLKRISEITVSSAKQLLQRWKEKEGTEINFTREMAELTIDIVAKSLFTTDITSEQTQIIWRNVNYLNKATDSMMMNPIPFPWRWPTPKHLKMRKYIAEMDAMVYNIINRRRQDSNPPPDLLQLLLEARYEETGAGMTDLQIRDEVMTIFVAGHETTVNALSWTWYLLKKNKAEEALLNKESLKFAGGHDPAFEDLPGMNYGRLVMNESMRMYPPVPVVARNPIRADESNGYRLPVGTELLVNIGGIHHHPAYWQNAFEFRPTRFENFDLKGDNRFLFMPFGGGPRICIGNNFAMLEMQLINAIISARVEMELVSDTIKPVALITLKPDKGVIMRLKKVL